MSGLRLAYLLKKFPRLSETFVLGEILGQEALGARVHVFARREPDDEPRHPQLAHLRAEVEVLPSGSGMQAWTELFRPDPLQPDLMERVGDLVRRTASYAVTTPAREVLYTVVSREEKYKSKSFIDTVVFRGGDAASAWLYSHAVEGLGSVGRTSAALMPLCLIWASVALLLGRGQRKRAEGLGRSQLLHPE